MGQSLMEAPDNDSRALNVAVISLSSAVQTTATWKGFGRLRLTRWLRLLACYVTLEGLQTVFLLC